ncbi:MAG TPA: shikimate kinase [Chloroflexi bacterium]|jgi:shikimate kinase|nr:shikimate kinase [Chloroflexota bacterium]HAL28598.1 shikimate kinase [Chloroflexota bacterium]
MKRVLLTGMSGTGKSTVIRCLAGLGYKAIDTDDGLSEWVLLPADSQVRYSSADGEWLWREDRVQQLLSTEDAAVLFVSGCARNQVRFYPLFDHIVLLTAPTGVILERRATRTTNPYGKRPDEVAHVLQLRQTVEPLLRRAASLELDTSVPVNEVLNAILDAVGARPSEQIHCCGAERRRLPGP